MVGRAYRLKDLPKDKQRKMTSNRRRWPLGSYSTWRAIQYWGLPCQKEKAIRWKDSFFQVDFAVFVARVFIEIDGPEHRPAKDAWREKQIHSIGKYKDWKFYRFKPSDVPNLTAAIQIIEPIHRLYHINYKPRY